MANEKFRTICGHFRTRRFPKLVIVRAKGSRAHEIQTTSRNCTNIVLFAEKPASAEQKGPVFGKRPI